MEGDLNGMTGSRNIHLGSNSNVEGSDNWSEGSNIKVNQDGSRNYGEKVRSFLARKPASLR